MPRSSRLCGARHAGFLIARVDILVFGPLFRDATEVKDGEMCLKTETGQLNVARSGFMEGVNSAERKLEEVYARVQDTFLRQTPVGSAF